MNVHPSISKDAQKNVRSSISKKAQKKADKAAEAAKKSPRKKEKVDLDKPNKDGFMPGQAVNYDEMVRANQKRKNG